MIPLLTSRLTRDLLSIYRLTYFPFVLNDLRVYIMTVIGSGQAPLVSGV